jgi:hypothetical protein
MSPGLRRTAVGALSLAVVALTAGTFEGSQASAAPPSPAWAGFAADAQHTGQAVASPQPLTRVHWQVTVDHKPSCCTDGPLAHYATPMITSANTVVVPVRMGPTRGFRVDGYAGADGAKKWSMPTDYTVPVGTEEDWPPPIPATLVDDHHVAVAGAGGTVLIRSRVDRTTGFVRRVAFYGIDEYRADRAAYRAAVQITTPLTTGPDGSLYFGFSATAGAPGHLHNGIARISPTGEGSWISARRLAGVDKPTAIALNSAPALSHDGKTGYLAVVTGLHGRLVGFDTTTLRARFRHGLRDPQTGQWAQISGSSSATPTVGPDGDVFYGVLGNPILRHDVRGWLLHFDATLSDLKTPGSFGWDQTVSVVPSTSVPSYTGSSSYLLVSKYNHYLILGHGDGHNEIALLDPGAAQKDRFSKVQVMQEVRTVLAPTQVPQQPPGAVYEWCINSVAVDPATGTALANNEDGHLYRWDLDTGQLVENIRLGPPAGEAYTMTVIGPDGTAYAMSNAVLYAVGS